MTRTASLPRIVLTLSIIAGVSYIPSWSLHLSQPATLAWKGAGVGLLAVYASLKARTLDGWLLAAVMAFGALGDVLLGAAGIVVGAVAFLAGHVIAVWLYLRQRDMELSFSRKALALCLVPLTVFLAYLLTREGATGPGIEAYALGLSLMAATAWTSRFPRYRVGIGAVMFVISDLLIFARGPGGPLPDNFLVGLAVWGLYYLGQLLICVGVTRTLAPDAASDDRAPLASAA